MFAAPSDGTKPSALTTEAIYKHDVRQSYANGEKVDSTVNDIASSLKSFAMDGDEEMEAFEMRSAKSAQTVASAFSACTNMSFNK